MNQQLNWRKSSRSVPNGACVEVALDCGRVMMRDSKDSKGPVLSYDREAWRAFISDVKADRVVRHDA